MPSWESSSARFNGYLIAGTIWFYMADAAVSFSKYHFCSDRDDIATMANTMLHYMPPKLLGIPGIYFAVVVAFIFVIVVFI